MVGWLEYPGSAGSRGRAEQGIQESNRQTCRAAHVLHYSVRPASITGTSAHLHGGSIITKTNKKNERTGGINECINERPAKLNELRQRCKKDSRSIGLSSFTESLSSTFREFPVCSSFFRISPERERHVSFITCSAQLLLPLFELKKLPEALRCFERLFEIQHYIWRNRVSGHSVKYWLKVSYQCCGTAIGSGFSQVGAEVFSK